MTENKFDLTIHGKPATEQASAANTTTIDAPAAAPAAEQTPAVDAITADTTAPATLPPDYLTGGYYATTDKAAKYLRPEFVGEQAQQIADALAGTRPSDFAAMLRDLKRAKKSTLPFEARQTAAAELLPRAIGLVHKKKAPSILTEFIKANLAAIKTDDDWSAFYRHMNAINSFLMAGGD